MTPREQLAAAALVGTAQQAFTKAAPTGIAELDAALARATGWLDAAALMVGHAAAGVMPAALSAAAAAADNDPRPMAVAHLEAVLRERRPLLPEWLALANEAGRRPAPEWIPMVLDAATNDRALRAAAARATGPTGLRLADLHDAWLWVRAAGEVNEALWETGRIDERLAVLRAVRAQDAAKSREMIDAVWSSENADVRRQLIDALGGPALSMDDEPLLEAALDDRSVQVRAAAAALLATLAGSRLVARMRERVAPRVTLKKEGLLGRKRVLDVELLEAPDAAAQRDGLDKKPPASKELGERGWWTLTALSAIPPAEWCARFGLEPAELILAAANGSWQPLFLSSWATAAGRYADATWLETLIPHMPSPLLFTPLAPAARERLALAVLEKHPPFLTEVTVCCPHPWSLAFTERFIGVAHGLLLKTQDHYRLRPTLNHAAHLAAPTARFPYDADQIGPLAAMLDTVAFRRQMRKALLESHGS
ncbi:MAG: hypothetical protein IT162_12105 [Bryobacterales bacterium]|nr:hypothetical protein [Bryobacterales bacterium]